MKTKLLYIYLSLIIGLPLHAQNNARAYLTVNLQDCVNCLRGGYYINEIDKQLSTSLIFRNQDKRVAKKVLHEIFEQPWPEENIIISDSIYFSLNKSKSTSMVHIITGNKTVYETELKTLPQKISQINSYAGKPGNDAGPLNSKTEFKLPDSVIISKGSSLFKSLNGFYIADNTFNTIYYTEKDRKLKVIDRNLFEPLKLHEAYFGETKSFKKYSTYIEDLKLAGREKPNLQAVSLSNDTLLVLINYFIANDTIFNERPTILIQGYPLLAEIYKGNVVHLFGITSTLSQYSISTAFPPNKIGSTYYLRVKTKNSSSPSYFLAGFRKHSRKLELTNLINQTLPVCNEDKTAMGNAFYSSDWANNWLYFHLCNKILDVKNSSWHTLPISLNNKFGHPKVPEPISENIHTLEKTSTGWRMLILESSPTKHFADYELTYDFKIKSRVEKAYPESIITTPVLISSGEWAAFNDQNKLVKLANK